MYYIYMLRCEDESIYTGITVDIQRRMQEHFQKNKKCAKYTFRHSAKKLECVWNTDTRANASKLEYAIKKLKKTQKEELILMQDLSKILGIEKENYELEIEYQKCFKNNANSSIMNKE